MKTAAPPGPLRLALLFLLTLAGIALLLFVPAGTAGWVRGWVYLGLFTAGMVCHVVYLQKVNPEVIAARMRATGEGTKTWDKIWSAAITPIVLAIYVVAGLDERHGWSSVPPWGWGAGTALFVVGVVILLRAMAVNPFFEKSVRIQRDRGHRVIDTGPYRFVRHPGYVGFVLGWIVAAPLLLDSVWAFVPAGVLVVAVVVRTALEDRLLRAELDGYAEYAQRVRYRLLPGIW